MIIDAHSHYMPKEVAENTTFFKVNWSDVDRQLSLMDSCHIQKALLLYPTSDAHINMGGWQNVCDVYNEKISEIVSKFNERFIGAGILPIDQPDKFECELKKIKDLNLKAISLASSFDGRYLDDDIFSLVYEFAQKNHMPVCVHSQIMNPLGFQRVDDPLLTPVLEYVFDIAMSIGKMMMSGTFLNFSDVKFIFAHYGGVIPFVRERFDNTYWMLRSRNYVKDLGASPSSYFKNLFFDTSGSHSLSSLRCALEVTDSKHILFGSDFPANHKIALSVKAIEESMLSEEDIHNILSNSILRDL